MPDAGGNAPPAAERKEGFKMTDHQDHRKECGEETDVDALVSLLDNRVRTGDSRITLQVEEGEGISRRYHHGRCDVGSPWACGEAFDVLEQEDV